LSEVIGELREHQQRLGLPPEDATDNDPREQLRVILGYLENNCDRMRYDEYRRQGLPTTSAWMESAVNEINYRVKGTEMFWNRPDGAEAILQIRAAASATTVAWRASSPAGRAAPPSAAPSHSQS
jgi:hypothetical protein